MTFLSLALGALWLALPARAQPAPPPDSVLAAALAWLDSLR